MQEPTGGPSQGGVGVCDPFGNPSEKRRVIGEVPKAKPSLKDVVLECLVYAPLFWSHATIRMFLKSCKLEPKWHQYIVLLPKASIAL